MIVPVTTQEHIAIIANLALKIWNQHYISIIGQAQVNYMISKFQNEETITKQINEGHLYYLISHANAFCGYLALVPDKEQLKLMISKIYIDADYRGFGLGLKLLNFAEEEAKKSDLKSLWLTVNKHNLSSIEWYKLNGFKIIKPVQFDIGNGFIMDDYLMEKSVK